MTSRDFCFWLQGFFEITDAGDNPNVKIDKGLTSEKVAVIKRHLALVFRHEIDPSMGPPAHQDELNNLHHGGGQGDMIMRC